MSGANAYANSADEVQALFIDGYDPRQSRGRDAELAHIRLRGEHCIGLVVNHVAQAMLAGLLSAEEEPLSQRSPAYGTGQGPIVADDCPSWDNQQVPMLLMGDLCAAEYGHFTPRRQRSVAVAWSGRAVPGRVDRDRVDRGERELGGDAGAARKGSRRGRAVSFGGDRELSTDEVVMAGIVAVGLGFAIAEMDWLLSNLGRWLVGHSILVDPAAAVVTIPYLGGLAVARLAILGGLGAMCM